MEAQELYTRLHRVPVEDIEGELDNLWRAANASALASGAHPGSRNSVLTLVVYTDSDDEAAVAFDLVDGLTAAHPSRAIVLAATRNELGAPIAASIGTQVATSASGTTSYGEDILLEARGEGVKHLPGVVLPLIVSGLPAYLWWMGEPPWHSEQFEAMVDGFDRLIVDSSELLHTEASLLALADLLVRKQSSVAISDFNWTRQAPWRELVAQFFDPPAQRPYAYGLDRVNIEYAAGSENEPANAASAFLFAGWLGARLNWTIRGRQRGQPGDPERQFTLTDAAGRPVVLQMTARFGTAVKSWHEIVDVPRADIPSAAPRPQPNEPPCVGPGALMSVHIHAGALGQTATFAVAREPDMRHASTLCQVPTGALPSQTVHLPSIGEHALLAEQIQLLGHDEMYEEALTMGAMLLDPSTRRASL